MIIYYKNMLLAKDSSKGRLGDCPQQIAYLLRFAPRITAKLKQRAFVVRAGYNT